MSRTMQTTLSNAANMQSADAFIPPPTTAPSSSMLQVAVGGKSSNLGKKAGHRALASLWIRRLKPREEPDGFLKGETFVSDIEMRQGLHASTTHPVGSHLQEASSTKTWAHKQLSKIRKLDEEKAVLKDALNEQISSSEQQDYGGERQQNLLNQGQGRVVQLATPYTSGFGQQIKQIADSKSESKLLSNLMTVELNVNSRYISEEDMILHTCSQAVVSKSQVSHAVRVQALEGGILASSLGKPPLPPSHNKAGLPPRPAAHRSPSFSAWSAGKISSSPTNNKLVAVPLQDIVRHPSHIAAMKESLLATNTSTGPLLKEGLQTKEDGMGYQNPLSKENGVCIEARRVLACMGVDRSISVPQKMSHQLNLECNSLEYATAKVSLLLQYLSLGRKLQDKILKQWMRLVREQKA